MKNSNGWLNGNCHKNSVAHISCEFETLGDKYVNYYVAANQTGRYNITISYLSPYTEANPPKEVGDIVARDLNVKVGGALGHIGMWTGRKVLEVFPTQPVIRQSTFSQFSKLSKKYWGSRYGKGTYVQRLKAIQIGCNESKYNPTYSYFDSAFPGREDYVWEIVFINKWSWNPTYRMVKRKKIYPGSFRCDSFVIYSYAKAGVRLLHGPYWPARVYNSMPLKR